MQIYMVGGAVRDTLLGLPVTDRDWVVVGATPRQMADQGFVAVGKDFPVFLHPRTHEQYALARTERKTAPGYRGFAIHAAPDVTLEQDLARRDLTINAMAVAAEYVREGGLFDPARAVLTDPYHGQHDLRHKVLRHVSAAFREDPVRVLRVARFAARFASFDVAAQTMALMRDMVRHGEVAALVAERVWQELASGLMEAAPVRMFEVLHACGALPILLPELGIFEAAGHATFADMRPMRVLAQAARRRAALPVRFACLCLHLVPAGAVAVAGKPITTLCQRLRVPVDCRELAEVTARERAAIETCTALDAMALVRLLERCDAFRKPARFSQILLGCECDASANASPAAPRMPYRQHDYLLAALRAAQAVATDGVAARARAAGADGAQIGAMVRAERAAAVAAWLARQ